MASDLRRWRCDEHEEGPVLMSSRHRPVCWVCRAPMVEHRTSDRLPHQTEFNDPMLAYVHDLYGGFDDV